MTKITGTTASSPREFRSTCPIACALDILGDKWTLLVIRDLFLNKHRYREFVESPERIPTNILADRLKRLEAEGIVKKVPYQSNPVRMEYFLTSKGADLGRVLGAMRKWAENHVPGAVGPETYPIPEIRDSDPKVANATPDR
jgi:DNA-binding HxlR family transcriptional regulator